MAHSEGPGTTSVADPSVMADTGDYDGSSRHQHGRRGGLILFPDQEHPVFNTSSLIGERVDIPPHTDAWARGDRHGLVAKVTDTFLHVVLDHSGRIDRFPVNGGHPDLTRTDVAR